MIAILHIAASMALAQSAPPSPPALKPTTRWVVDYDDAQCVASRNYGTADKPLFLALKPSPRQTMVRLMLIRKGWAEQAVQSPAVVRFDNGQPLAVNALAYANRESRRYIAAVNLPMKSLLDHRRATSIAIRGASFDERLAVPGLAGVIAAFDDCLANLRQVWNVGEPNSSRISRPARSLRPLRELFTRGAYPSQALREGNTGTVGLSLLIDETGKVRDCMVEDTSGFATLDTMSCQVITEQAKYEPALGVDGKPVKSAEFHRINWQIAR